MPATDTAPPPDATPQPPAAAGKAGASSRRSTAAATQDAPTAGPAAENTSGWFRNTSAGDLTTMPNRYPSAVLKPGEARWLPEDPQFPHLEPCDAPTAAADTTRSEP